jgi:hypothetical protein
LLWGWVSDRCGGVRTITSESWGVFDSHFTDLPSSVSAPELDKITGSVKLSVVGYGRKTQEGGDTLGGRSATELSANSWVFKGKLERAVFDIVIRLSLD